MHRGNNIIVHEFAMMKHNSRPRIMSLSPTPLLLIWAAVNCYHHLPQYTGHDTGRGYQIKGYQYLYIPSFAGRIAPTKTTTKRIKKESHLFLSGTRCSYVFRGTQQRGCDFWNKPLIMYSKRVSVPILYPSLTHPHPPISIHKGKRNWNIERPIIRKMSITD